jgi:hypothetical protein
MPHLVIVLGAGASAPGGCPVMSNFFNTVTRLVSSGRLVDFEADASRIQEVRDELDRRSYRSSFDRDNLEQVLNVIESGVTLGGLGAISTEQLIDARSSLLRIIAQVLQKTQQFEYNTYPDELFSDQGSQLDYSSSIAPKLTGPLGYDMLARMLRWMMRTDRDFTCSVVTFNYDLGLEVALQARGLSWTSGNDPKNYPRECIKIFKPHGSLGCMGPEDIYDSRVRERIANFLKWQRDGQNSIPPKLSLHEHADAPPFIVPPSDDKAAGRREQLGVWKRSLSAIKNANLLFVGGYSLPETDQFVRHWFSIANVTDVPLRSVFLCDPSGLTIDRWTKLLGAGVQNRICHHDNFLTAGSQFASKYIQNGFAW